MRALILAANIFGWPMIHGAFGAVAVRLPHSLFEQDTWLTAPRSWERGGRIYAENLAIRKWKSTLPDGAPWLGGIAKKQMVHRSPSSLAALAVETRRAELAHWGMLGCAPVFFLWNPPWACFVMAAYAIVANLPCIVAQRYNRAHVLRVLDSRKRAVKVA